jgi:hypothetical protein
MLSLHFSSQLNNCLIGITCYSFMIEEIKLQFLYLLLKLSKLKLNRYIYQSEMLFNGNLAFSK